MGAIQQLYVGGSYGTIPGAPIIGTATATSGTTATVSFTAPASDGGSPITSYTATSTPGGRTGTVNQSGSGAITVTGLNVNTSYTFTVRAINSIGTGPSSGSSDVAGWYETTYTSSGSATIPAGFSQVEITGTGGAGTYTPPKGDDRVYATYVILRYSSGYTDTLSGPYSVPQSNLSAANGQSVQVYKDSSIGGGYEGSLPMSWIGSIYEFNGTLNGTYYQGYVIPDGGTYQEVISGSPPAPAVYTTGGTTTVQIAGGTSYSFPGGYGGAASPVVQTATISTGGQSISYTVASGGSVKLRYSN